MKIRCIAKTARRLIPRLLVTQKFSEVNWITRGHFADPDYECGWFIGRHVQGDWTDHPRYSGSIRIERDDWVEHADFILTSMRMLSDYDVVTIVTAS